MASRKEKKRRPMETKIKPISEDVEFLRQTVFNLREEVDQFKIHQDISRQLLCSYDFDQIVRIFLNIVEEILNYDFCVLYLFEDPQGDAFRVAKTRGISQQDLTAPQLDREVIDWVLREGRWTLVSVPEVAGSTSNHAYSILPLQGVKRNLGFLLIATTETHDHFTQSNINYLSSLAAQASISIENQKLYDQLSRSRDYVKNILECINNGIIIIDMDDRITQLNKNATAMLGLTSADLIGLRYQEALPPKLADMVREVKDQALANGFALERMFEYSPTKDFQIPLGINASLLLDDKAERIGVVVVFRHMLVLKELERLRQLDSLKSEFVSNVSHELRSPLSVIKSYVEAILNRVDPKDYQTQRKFCSVIDEEADRLTVLVDDLLDISRIESGKFEILRESVNILEIMSVALRSTAGKSAVHRIVIDVPDDLPNIKADKDKLVRAFSNLLDNAVKFSPEGGQITLNAKASGQRIKLEIQDQGIGIAEEDIPHIFDKFFRVDNSDVYEIPGTGLGLPIVKHIVESHEGDLSVSSRPGYGTTFTVWLPWGQDTAG